MIIPGQGDAIDLSAPPPAVIIIIIMFNFQGTPCQHPIIFILLQTL
jgi:hypothetical protein